MLIMIVEDDENIREIESYALRSAGFEVKECESGRDCLKDLGGNIPDLILLDIMLPGEDGMAVLRQLREKKETNGVPVMMITAKSLEIDKVKALDAGADDYMVKPFGVMELVSRVKAILRRSEKKEAEEGEVLTCGIVELDVRKHVVRSGENTCTLTYKEFELLHYLIKNQGIVLSRDQLMVQVWGFDYEGETRTVDMHIKTLRQKLGNGGKLIKTVRNVGYKAEQES